MWTLLIESPHWRRSRPASTFLPGELSTLVRLTLSPLSSANKGLFRPKGSPSSHVLPSVPPAPPLSQWGHGPAGGVRGHVPILGATQQHLSRERLHHPGHRRAAAGGQREQPHRHPAGADLRSHGVGSQAGALQTPERGAALPSVHLSQQRGKPRPGEVAAQSDHGGPQRLWSHSYRL